MLLTCRLVDMLQLDKICISYASIMGLREDLGLSLRQYSWLSSIFCESSSTVHAGYSDGHS